MLATLLKILFVINVSQSSFKSCQDVYDSIDVVDRVSVLNTKSFHYIEDNHGDVRQIMCAFIKINDTAVFIANLFESFSLSSGAFNATLSSQAMFDDFGENEQDLTNLHESYRWNKDRILSMHEFDKTYLFMTCNFDISMSKDYVLTKFYSEFLWDSDIGTDNNCYKVEYSNIRGYQCDSQSVNFWSLSKNMHFRIDSHFCHCQCCQWNNGSVASEDNFGFYKNFNPEFACSATDASTTNYWLGSIVHHQTCEEMYFASNRSLTNITAFTAIDDDSNTQVLMCSFVKLQNNATFIGTLVRSVYFNG